MKKYKVCSGQRALSMLWLWTGPHTVLETEAECLVHTVVSSYLFLAGETAHYQVVI